jgi:hypothetical protein
MIKCIHVIKNNGIIPQAHARTTVIFTEQSFETASAVQYYRVIPSVLDPRKCEYLKDYPLDFE